MGALTYAHGSWFFLFKFNCANRVQPVLIVGCIVLIFAPFVISPHLAIFIGFQPPRPAAPWPMWFFDALQQS
jgi:hypothetical protein